jgi:hypothetical protein
MTEPRAQTMAGVVSHRAQLGHRAEGIRYPLGSPFVVRRKAYPDVAVIEDQMILAVGLLDLIERLRDQESS